MRKFYLAGLAVLFLVFVFSTVNAQRKVSTALSKAKRPTTSVTNSGVGGTTADCDTVNYPISNSWTPVYYITGTGGSGGFVTGTNQYGDKQKANYFDLSATSYTYLLGARFYFAVANSNVVGNRSKNVLFKVYDDNGGAPGSQLGTTEQMVLSSITPQADAGQPTDITFTTPIQLPASKKFYISVDVSNFKWVGSTKDSVAVYSTQDGEVSPGTGWEQWSDNSWSSIYDGWGGLNTELLIHPFVSTSSSACDLLPVKLLSFNAQRNNKDVTLNWQIADEYNMKAYEVERADNNGSFKTVQSIAALNYAKNQSYSVTDKNAFTSAATVQYRLKQIDGDGSVKYSRVIAVKANAIISDISFANPFSGALKLQLNLAATQNISVQVFDMQGKAVVSQLNKMYNASSNSIILDGTSSLKPGMYVLKINAGAEQLQYKVIKQ